MIHPSLWGHVPVEVEGYTASRSLIASDLRVIFIYIQAHQFCHRQHPRIPSSLVERWRDEKSLHVGGLGINCLFTCARRNSPFWSPSSSQLTAQESISTRGGDDGRQWKHDRNH